MSKHKKKVEREYLLQIIDLCQMVERRGSNPFEVDVKEILEKLRECLPGWEMPKDFCLDAKTLYEIADLVRLQGEWIKHRSSSLYVDSILVALKIGTLGVNGLAHALLRAWHPIIAIEQLSSERLRDAINYWNGLLPLKVRMAGLPFRTGLSGVVDVDELFRLGILSKEEFNSILISYWKDLVSKTEGIEKMSYREFVYADDFESTVARGYFVSFMVTYGYATLEADPIANELFIVPLKEPMLSTPGTQGSSVPVSISYEDWKKHRQTKGEYVDKES